MHEIKLPQLGQSVEEAAIVEWRKQEGDAVSQGEVLFTVQTDKAEIECESTATGTLRKILIEPDIEVPVMTVVALVGEPGEDLPNLSQYGAPTPAGGAEAKQPESATPAPQKPAATPAPSPSSGQAPVSPRALRKAAELGVDPAQVTGTGARGRIMEADIIAFAEAGGGPVRATPTAKRVAERDGVDLAGVSGTGPRGKVMKGDVLAAGQAPVQGPTAAPSAAPGERIKLTPMRKIIAERLSASKFSAPHYYVSVEVDMANATAFRKSAAGFKPSFNDLVLHAAAQALREHPEVNARWDEDYIETYAEVNMGFAVALPTGLVVPVIRGVQNLSLEGIHKESRALTEKARGGKLTPDDYTGSTFTVSNLGALGVDQFTAIINPPNSAILAVGAIKEKPVVIDGGIHIRPMMNLTLSSDHRVIDGAVAAQFLATLRTRLEEARF